MSVADDSVLPAPLQQAGVAAERDVAAAYRLPVYIACTLLALVTNYCGGKELAFDSLNYHFYAGFNALHDRFGQDYFAAGFRSYFNPYAYIPFYVLVTSGLTALQVASAMAAIQSAVLWLTYEMALLVCPTGSRRARIAVGLCAVALAFGNPILMQQFGSSFSDITTAELVLAAWLLLARAVEVPRPSLVFWAGLICGVATGLKLTNAVHALAGFAVVLMVPLGIKGRIRYATNYGVALALGCAIVMVPWCIRLEREFGNPLFPFMNGLFRSPYFTTARLFDYRFVPANLIEALWRPFEMIKPMAMVHEELRAPDLRYATLAMLLAVLALQWVWRHIRAKPPSISATSLASTRVLIAVGIGFIVDWSAWLTESGNSRYFLPMACVAAVVVVALAFRVFSGHPKVRNYVLVAMFSVQALQLWFGTTYRWAPARWGGPWFNVDVPKKLASEPNLYLTMGAQSNSFIAPFLASGSGLINFTGSYALGEEGANGARIQQLMRRYAPHLRMLVRGKELYADPHYVPNQTGANEALERFGLRADMSDCETIAIHGLYHQSQLDFSGVKPVDEGAPDTTYLASCRLIPDQGGLSTEEVKARQDADVVLNRLEDSCPLLFQPSRVLTEHVGHTWLRYYVNTDLTAWVSRGWVKFNNPIQGDGLKFVGSEVDWLKAPQRVLCGRENGHYFAKVVGRNGEG